jgi:ribulose-phosphate 3-epimerase
MVESPETKIEWFRPAPGDYVSVHTESTVHLQRALQKIKGFGAKSMAALNPSTPLSVLEYVLDDIDGVLLMTVNPGFSGQKVIPQTIKKVENLRKWLDDCGYPDIEIEVDGNVSLVNAPLMRKAGANIFVAGTSGLFMTVVPINEQICRFSETISRKEITIV